MIYRPPADLETPSLARVRPVVSRPPRTNDRRRLLFPHMSRAAIAYVLMFAALIVGMGVILRVGSRLVAPADLEGAWAVAWAGQSRALPTKLTLEQSGVFATAHLGDRAYAGRLIRYAGKATVSGVLRSRDGTALMLAPYDGGD